MEIKNSYKHKGINLIGQRHGRLTIIEKSDKGRSWWRVKCDCGNTMELLTSRFYVYKSCGCLEKSNRAALGKKTTTHGMTETTLYKKWCGMKARCYNPNTPHYERYGGRGITMCDEWQKSFESFRDWAYSVGYEENEHYKNLSIDRIDPNGNYEPTNCRWSTTIEQARNKENSVYVKVDNIKMPLEEVSEKYSIPSCFISRRIKKGQSIEEIVADWNFVHNDSSDYMKIEEAIEYYNVGRSTIDRWIKSGKLKAEKHGIRWYIFRGQEIKSKLA